MIFLLNKSALTNHFKGEHAMRLNQYISSAGVCSRRHADKLIKEQRVTVNGEIIPFHYRVKQGDIVEVDGQQVLYRLK